jgi:KDO2-lipid IV(A) lauroyltransferase
MIKYISYRFIWWFVSVLPKPIAYSLAKSTGNLIYRQNGKGVQRLRNNYLVVKPNLSSDDLEKLTKDGVISYWRYWCDTFRLNKWNKSQIIQTVSVTNEHLLVDSVNQKLGCLVALPHAGNWDHAGAYFCQIGIPLTTVAEKLEPEKIFLKFLDYRQQIGMEILNHKEKTIPTLTERLKQGKLWQIAIYQKMESKLSFLVKLQKCRLALRCFGLRQTANSLPLLLATPRLEYMCNLMKSHQTN